MKKKHRKGVAAFTEVCVGERSVVVPCVVAFDTKHLINKFRLVVTDVNVEEPYRMDDIQRQEFYELVLTVKPSKALARRRFRDAHERTSLKFAMRYGWNLTIVEE